MAKAIHRMMVWAAVCVLPPGAGCLSPELVNQTVGGLYPTAPGDQPFVAVRVINETSSILDIPIVYDDGSVPTYRYLIQALTPMGRDTGIVLEWPIMRVAVGDLDNPYLPQIVAYYSNGATSGVFFGHHALQAGVDFERGDTIIFRFVEDSRSPAYIRVDPGRIAGSSQQGTFSRGDPFQRLQLLMQATGY
ncbi:MAG TPA: hypothetical protein VLM89_05235 [Phycisphaerae bacterium]|nr:hypothetical protein [Phycisphaerae bacterium]